MTTSRDLERRLADHLHGEGPSRAPDWVLRSALTTIETTRQRRGMFAPWRYFDMPTYARLAAAAIVVIAVGGLALWRLAPPGPGGPGLAPTPTPSPTTASTGPETPVPSTYVAPALTESFTSDFHGLALTYPAGWSTQPATKPWATAAPFTFRDQVGDFFWDPSRTDHLFLAAASQPLAGTTFDVWSTQLLSAEGCTSTGAVTIDGVEGVLGDECGQALVASGGRGYVFWLYRSGDDVELQGVDWSAWLEDILATVQLLPADAVDPAPSASPAASPGG